MNVYALLYREYNNRKMISVLYVDDEAVLLDIVKIHLERAGIFRVETVESAKDALQKLKEKEYDAIVSDFQMPEMDGIESLKVVRKEYPRLPFIIFTGRGREAVAIEALSQGPISKRSARSRRSGILPRSGSPDNSGHRSTTGHWEQKGLGLPNRPVQSFRVRRRTVVFQTGRSS
jgi:CheY-like chemotaxis protein